MRSESVNDFMNHVEAGSSLEPRTIGFVLPFSCLFHYSLGPFLCLSAHGLVGHSACGMSQGRHLGFLHPRFSSTSAMPLNEFMLFAQSQEGDGS